MSVVMMEFPDIPLVDWLILILILCMCAALVLFIFKVYRIFRPPKEVKVNCWFCNENTRVPYGNRNCFNCPYCDQYNGFDQFGHYNKPIPAQYHEEFNQPVGGSGNKANNQQKTPEFSLPVGDLCDQCNVNQNMKVQQLAAFVPYVEDNFDAEVEHFQDYLEELYPLCELCEDTVHWVLRYQEQQLKMKLLGRMLQDSSPTTPSNPSKTIRVPLYIIFLRLITVVCAIICLLIDLQQCDVVDVKTSLKTVITDIPPIGRHRPSIILTGLTCVIVAALVTGKNRLRHIDAVLPLVWLLSLSLHWQPPSWLSSLHILDFISQLPWLQNIDSWLPWWLCWHLGVSISCVLCSLVFLISSKQVIRERKFKRRDNHQSRSQDTSAVSSMSDELPSQEDNDVSMASDHVTPPPISSHHQRGVLDESANSGLAFDNASFATAYQRNLQKDVNNTSFSSAYRTNSAYGPHSQYSKQSSRFIRLMPFCIIFLRCLAVVCALICLVIDLHQNNILDVKKRSGGLFQKSDISRIVRHRFIIVSAGLTSFIIAALFTRRNRINPMVMISLLVWFLSLSLSWKPSWLTSLPVPEFMAQLPWLQNIDKWLPWHLCWILSISISCVFYSLVLLFFSSDEIENKRKMQKSTSADSLQDNSTAPSSTSSESADNDVTMESPIATTNDGLNTLTLGPPTGKRKQNKGIWTERTSSPNMALNSNSPSSSQQQLKRPIIHPARLQSTSRSNFTIGQQSQGHRSSRRGFSNFGH